MEAAIIEKIKKLLALSKCQSGNINETASAAARVSELMAKYDISFADLDTGNEVSFDFSETSIITGKKIRKWKRVLIEKVSRAFSCRSILDGQTVVVFGNEERALCVKELCDFLFGEIEYACSCWRNRNPIRKKNQSYDFKLGAATTVGDRVKNEYQQKLKFGAGAALMRIDTLQKKVREEFNKKYRSVSSPISKALNKSAYNAGKIAGMKININNTKYLT